MMTTHEKTNEQPTHALSYYDNLTGLAHKRYYHERMSCLLKTAARRNEQFAFLFIDLDDFKDVNDRYGTQLGDQFLHAIAQRLKLVVREVDFIARLEGDQFCIILDNITDDHDVIKVINRCLQKIKKPLTIETHQLTPSASIGAAIYPRDGINESDLMSAADFAMHQAKQAGKQGYVFYSKNKSWLIYTFANNSQDVVFKGSFIGTRSFGRITFVRNSKFSFELRSFEKRCFCTFLRIVVLSKKRLFSKEIRTKNNVYKCT